MRVVVTGAGGFIGSHVVRELQAFDHDVHAILRPGGTRLPPADIAGRNETVELDLADVGAVRQCLQSIKPDVVVHLAWYAEPGKYLDAVDENRASLASSHALVASATDAGCRRIVVAGTCLEHSPGESTSPYIVAKRSLHGALERVGEAGMSWACGHVFYLYGPAEDRRRVVPSVIRALLASERIATTDGRQPRDYLHVADVAAGFRYLAEAPISGGVDICSGRVIMLRDILLEVAREIGRTELLDLGRLGSSPDPGYPHAGDASTLRSLGWIPKYDVRSGVADAVRWWRQQGSTA